VTVRQSGGGGVGGLYHRKFLQNPSSCAMPACQSLTKRRVPCRGMDISSSNLISDAFIGRTGAFINIFVQMQKSTAVGCDTSDGVCDIIQ
jgi:hypothetical protein